jgi:hypothetical protein
MKIRQPLHNIILLSLAVFLAFLSTTSAASTIDNTDSHVVKIQIEEDPWDIYHPLDEGIWSDEVVAAGDTDGDVLREVDVSIDPKLNGLRNTLRLAEIDSLRLFSKPPLSHHNGGVMKPLSYTIFGSEGQSALKSLDSTDQHLVCPHYLFGIAPALVTPAHYRVCAALLLLRGYSDAAHEMLLGVTLDNLDEAEYAATHRGETDWAQKHPLTDSSDILHAAIHRLIEGHDVGEGGQTGYENSKYWLAGGPNLLSKPQPHPVRTTLARIARQHTPRCISEGNLIAPKGGAKHSVLSGAGKTRTVFVPHGQWDDFCFLKLCQRWADGDFDCDRDMMEAIATLQRAEIVLLLRYELLACLRGTSGQSMPSTMTTTDPDAAD